ncbi:MAG: trypsin-like peptidase domain-containing protein [Symploca sp. SIO2G7]|nr:trypsin-like peptidase domain-containing protein [Symploca sp. SIO2G7]
MKLTPELPAIFTGTAIVSALVVVLPQAALALTGEEVNDIAREVTVLISGENSHGSGVIVSQNGDTYYVLTANHVVAREDDHKIVTADKKAYAVDYGKVKRLPGVDLAVVEFSSEEDYQVAKLANSDQVTEGKPVFVSGWPAPGSTNQLIRQFTDGRVSGFLPQSYEGYQMIYTNVTRRGMSGGPVLDAGGRVVGIHGLADAEDAGLIESQGVDPDAARSIAGLIKPGFNYAIPIKTFLTLAPQEGLYLSLDVDNSAAPPLGAPYVANSEPDSRDTIDDINSTLDTVNDAVDTLRNVCGFLGC